MHFKFKKDIIYFKYIPNLLCIFYYLYIIFTFHYSICIFKKYMIYQVENIIIIQCFGQKILTFNKNIANNNNSTNVIY